MISVPLSSFFKISFRLVFVGEVERRFPNQLGRKQVYQKFYFQASSDTWVRSTDTEDLFVEWVPLEPVDNKGVPSVIPGFRIQNGHPDFENLPGQCCFVVCFVLLFLVGAFIWYDVLFN